MSNSIAVRQFLMLAGKSIPVQKPCNPFRVVSVVAEERYCLHCCGKRHMDVIYGQNPHFLNAGQANGLVFEKATICRACGKVIAHPSLAKVKWIGGYDE